MIHSLPVYISSGGASRRFGSEKARALLPDGRTLIEHVAQKMQPISAKITVVADRPGKYADLGMRTIADQHPGLGPLAGLQAALLDALQDADEPTWIFYTSCDFLGFDPYWIQQLWNARMPESTAVVFRSQPAEDPESARWEPVFALYHTQLLDAVSAALNENQLTFWRFLEAVSAQSVSAPEGWASAISINTPADLQTYLRATNPIKT